MAEVGVERVFSLGNYNSFRVKVHGAELDDLARQNLIVGETLSVFEAYFWHQKLRLELDNQEATEWDERLLKVQELRDKYMEVQE